MDMAVRTGAWGGKQLPYDAEVEWVQLNSCRVQPIDLWEQDDIVEFEFTPVTLTTRCSVAAMTVNWNYVTINQAPPVYGYGNAGSTIRLKAESLRKDIVKYTMADYSTDIRVNDVFVYDCVNKKKSGTFTLGGFPDYLGLRSVDGRYGRVRQIRGTSVVDEMIPCKKDGVAYYYRASDGAFLTDIDGVGLVAGPNVK